MTDYAWDLQVAVEGVLTAASLPGITRIVDHPIAKPSNSDFPFVQIGEFQSLQDDTTCNDGSQDIFDIHVWSRYRGQKEVKQIMGAVHAALHDATLSVPGLASSFAFVEGERVLDDPDGLTRHGVVTVRIYSRKGA